MVRNLGDWGRGQSWEVIKPITHLTEIDCLKKEALLMLLLSWPPKKYKKPGWHMLLVIFSYPRSYDGSGTRNSGFGVNTNRAMGLSTIWTMIFFISPFYNLEKRKKNPYSTGNLKRLENHKKKFGGIMNKIILSNLH